MNDYFDEVVKSRKMCKDDGCAISSAGKARKS